MHIIMVCSTLGGVYGVLEGPFAVSHLLQVRTMGEYINLLDSHGVCGLIKDSGQQDSTDAEN